MKKRMPERRGKFSFRKKLMLSVISILIFLVAFLIIIELFARLTYHERLLFQRNLGDSYILNRQDSSLFYVLTPNYSRYANYTYLDKKVGTIRYTHNNNGFRSEKDYNLKKSEEAFRILILGDSVTYGAYVNQSDIFSVLLEKKLNSKENKYEVLNAGTGGYNTQMEYYWLKEIGIGYEPDLVIVVYDYTDVEEVKNYIKNGSIVNNHVESPPIPLVIRLSDEIDKFLSENSRAYQAINLGLYGLLKNKIELGEIKFFDTSLETAITSIKEIDNICKERNFDLLFVISPSLSGEEPFQDNVIRQKLKNLNLSTIDLYDEFNEFGINKLKLSNEDTVHPNKEGHRIIAEKIYNWIKLNEDE